MVTSSSARGAVVFGPDDFVGGVPALDFINTVDNWHATTLDDKLVDVEAWLDWARTAGVLDATESRRAISRVPQDPAATRLLGELKRFREQWRDLLQAILSDEPTPAGSLESLDRLWHRALAARQLEPGRESLAISWRDGNPPWERALHSVVLSAVALVTDPNRLTRVHECPAADCGWFFLDTSKNGSRRWCSMETCGNLAKARRFHARHRGR